VSAPELARRLGVSPKTLRAWLRGQAGIGHPLLAGHEHQGRWWLTEVEARQFADEYRRRR
jgi:transposase-like protein